ncbi:50S ribosomal protein L22 [Candidatus Woesearchaeota archaeon]|jgi:large subunit ribosomal protein L22|nr:50S ribosomal protein L22 [Candidatus Woesearchaeota archaeon]MBT6520314.1 50S ribosomal protein L22 [Candidatus Woesearchaeota archaeon]MBT7368267.1 50S ribosomal protein L22 [Candidatus Woesearchaeota archaeon]
MAKYNYAFQGYDEQLMARAVGRDVNVSPKIAIEVSNFLRFKNLQKAKQILENVQEKTQAVPFKRFTNGPGHRRGKMAAGRYPVKAAGIFLKLFENAEINAQNKGFNTGNLKIIHLCSHIASRPMRHGRKKRCVNKRAHIEIVVQEIVEPKKEKRSQKSNLKKSDLTKFESTKPEAKPVAEKSVEKKEKAKPEVKTEAKVEDKPVEVKPEVKEEVKPEVKTEEPKEEVKE